MSKYPSLSSIAGMFRLLAYLVFGLFGLFALVALVTPGGTLTRFGGLIGAIIFGLVIGGLLLAASESIAVLIDIEANTRRTHELLAEGQRAAAKAAGPVPSFSESPRKAQPNVTPALAVSHEEREERIAQLIHQLGNAHFPDTRSDAARQLAAMHIGRADVRAALQHAAENDSSPHVQAAARDALGRLPSA